MREPLLAATFATTCALLALGTAAGAQPVTAPVFVAPQPGQSRVVPAAAVARYERSRAYYAAGRYRAAIVELEAATRIDPGGYNLYFDLGLVYERLGQADRAAVAYRQYLRHVDDAGERERAQRILRRLAGARVELAEIAARPGRADGLFWGFSTGALLGLVGGTALVVSGSRASSDSDRDTQFVLGASALGTGAALGITAGLLYALREGPPRNAPLCVVALGPLGGSLHLRF